MMEKIPCTVGILTRNSGETLKRALESVQDFAECIICDGGSSDDTEMIAETYGARVMRQDRSFLDAQGRILDYAGVRNQTLRVARQDWFLFLDADEYLTVELSREIRGAIQGRPRAYWITRRYTWNGRQVTCSTTYPNKQMRLFHVSLATRFIKTVHERIELVQGAVIKSLKSPMMVPMDTTPEALWLKWQRYIDIELARHGDLAFRGFLVLAGRHLRSSLLYALRFCKIFLFCRGVRLPAWRELAEHTYNLRLLSGFWKQVKKNPMT